MQEKNKKGSAGYFAYLLIAVVLVGIGFYVFGDQSDSGEKGSSGRQFNLSDRGGGPEKIPGSDFKGDAGTNLVLAGGQIQFEAADLDGGKVKFFNVVMPGGKIVYFFAVKDKNGIYRAAANACQVCYDQKKGFYQQGNEVVCRNCGNRYPLEKIATEKGGCNPAPINPDLKEIDGKITIGQEELEQVLEFAI